MEQKIKVLLVLLSIPFCLNAQETLNTQGLQTEKNVSLIKSDSISLRSATITGGENNDYDIFQKFNPVSPSAAALMKVSNYPVNHSTGLVNITIPLYEIKSGDLILPITLTYHNAGYKPHEPSGWIGLGWTLNAGPSITRAVNGKPDEYGLLREGRIELDRMPPADKWLYLDALGDNLYDEDPDGFYYSLLDKSGGFLVNDPPVGIRDWKISTIPYEPVKIETNESLSSFTITNDQGICHYFSHTERTSSRHPLYERYVSQWKISSIKSSRTEAGIKFSYHDPYQLVYSRLKDGIIVQHGKFTIPSSTESNFPEPNTYLYNRKSYIHKSDDYFNFYLVSGTTNQLYPKYHTEVGLELSMRLKKIPDADVFSRVDELNIQEIEFSGGKVLFFKNTQGNRIDRIEVRDKQGRLLRKINFQQTEYNGYTLGGNPVNQCALNGLRILDANGQAIENYQFSYYDNYFLDHTQQKGLDHWGYSNGDYNGGVPYQKIPVNNDGGVPTEIYIGTADKSPHIDYLKQNALKSILYPTGGTTEFQYEMNRYYDDQNGEAEGGGLRICKITSKDSPTGKEETRTFKYGISNTETGIGIARYIITPEDYIVNHESLFLIPHPEYKFLLHLERSNLTTYLSSPKINLSYPNGAYVVYPRITEYIDGKGKIEYNYNYPYLTSYFSPHNHNLPIEKDGRRFKMEGQLLSEKFYKLSGGNYIPEKENGMEYFRIAADTVFYAKAYKFRDVINLGVTEAMDMPEYLGIYNVYYHVSNILTEPVLLRKKTSVEYFQNSALTTVEDYNYNNRFQLKEIKTTNSDGSVLKKEFLYPFDLTLSGDAEIGRNKLIGQWNIGAILEKKQTTGADIFTTAFEYKLFGQKPLPFRINDFTNGNLKRQANFHSYDKFGNPTSISYEGAPHSVLLWGYNHQYLIAEIKNASYDYVVSRIPGGENTLDTIAAKAVPSDEDMRMIDYLRNSLLESQVTTYTYRPLVGMTSMTDHRGIVTEYIYDSSGRLKEVKVDGKKSQNYQYNYQH